MVALCSDIKKRRAESNWTFINHCQVPLVIGLSKTWRNFTLCRGQGKQRRNSKKPQNSRIQHWQPIHPMSDSKYFWNTSDQVKKATLAMVNFMDHLLALPPKQISDDEIDEVRVWKGAVLQLVKNMENLANI